MYTLCFGVSFMYKLYSVGDRTELVEPWRRHFAFHRDSEFSLRNAILNLKLKLSYDRQSVDQFVLVSGSRLEPMTRFSFSVTIAGFLIWNALSDERTGL
jgi:hypothetical protein